MSPATSSPVNLLVKSQLAKLLATENLRVENKRGIYTAKFDTETRVLTLPVWDHADNDLYDMLVAHEVGHALHTPVHEIVEPLLKAVDAQNPNHFKSYVNITEDIRIDRMIRESFPGLRRSYFNAYKQLAERDFFDLKSVDGGIASLSFGDRLNIHAKGGQYGFFGDIPFTDEEREIVDAAFKAETFEDSVNVAARIYAMSQKSSGPEPQKVPVQNDPSSSQSGCKGGTGEGSGSSETEVDANADTKTNGIQGSGSSGGHGGMMPSSAPLLTTDAAENSIKNLISQKKRSKYGDGIGYYDCPRIDLSQVIFPYKTVMEDLNTMRSNGDFYGKEIFDCIQNTNKSVILNLVKQFEQKMAADAVRRTSYAKTGELNMRKIANYKFSEDIFLRNKVVQNGKNHGMVFVLDWSGSMSNTLMETVEQLLVLCLFCRRMNIPFDVYAFTNAQVGYREYNGREVGGGPIPSLSPISPDYKVASRSSSYGETYDELDIGSFLAVRSIGMIHFLSSMMTNNDFRTAAENLCQLARNQSGCRADSKFAQFGHCYGGKRIINNYSLSGTPLNEAIYTSIFIVNQFKARHRCDIVNTIFLTDGEAGGSLTGYDRYERPTRIVNLPDRTQMILGTSDQMEKCYNSGIGDSWVETSGIVKIFRAMTGSNAIGIRIETTKNGTNLMPRFVTNPKMFEKARVTWKDENFFACGSDFGFDELFFIDSTVDTISNDDILKNLPENASTTRIASAFIRGNSRKMTSRTLLNRFTDLISKKVLA